MKHSIILNVRLAAALMGFLLFAGCPSWNTASRAPVPNTDDFRSVLMLSDGAGHLASGFILVRNGRQYIVTAKHFAEYMSGHDSVELFVNGGWVRTPTHLIGHGAGEVDISVFSFSHASILKPEDASPILSGNDRFDLGTNIWYLGFPLGFMFDNPERNYPYPLLKHAYLSTESDRPLMYYLDGLCNPGFSGGPVFAVTTNGELRLIGVVSARLKENSDPASNSGIFLAYSAEYAEELIDRNPTGAPLQ